MAILKKLTHEYSNGFHTIKAIIIVRCEDDDYIKGELNMPRGKGPHGPKKLRKKHKKS